MGASGDLLESWVVESYRPGRGVAISGEPTPEVLMTKAVREGGESGAIPLPPLLPE